MKVILWLKQRNNEAEQRIYNEIGWKKSSPENRPSKVTFDFTEKYLLHHLLAVDNK